MNRESPGTLGIIVRYITGGPRAVFDPKWKSGCIRSAGWLVGILLVIFVIIVVAAVAILGGLLYWLHARHYVSTDDAYIDGHVTQISPQVAGRILSVASEWIGRPFDSISIVTTPVLP